MIKVAFIVPDNRDEQYTYDKPEPIFGPAPASLLDGFSKIDGCEIHVISSSKKRVAAPAKLAPNIFFHSVYTPRFGRFRTLYASSFVGVRRLISKLQPDIVHGQGAERYPALSAATSGFPNVVTLHGIVSQLAKVNNAPRLSFLGIHAFMEAAALKRTNGVICLSSHGQRIVSSVNPRTWCIPNGVDESFFASKWAPVDPPEIVYAAHIYPLKNQVALVKALDSIATRRRFTLRLLGRSGDASYYQELQDLARTRPWCRLDGFIEGDALREAFSHATILAHPSLEENCPMAVLEAMAIGVPVAASKAGGIPDLVDDGKTGLLFDPKNHESIASAVDRILSDSNLARQFGQAARIRAEKEFKPEMVARRHLEIYREVLGR